MFHVTELRCQKLIFCLLSGEVNLLFVHFCGFMKVHSARRDGICFISGNWRGIVQKTNVEQLSQTLLWEAQIIYSFVS